MEANSEAGEWLQEETGALGQRLNTRKGIEGRHLWRVCWVPEGMGVMEEVGVRGQGQVSVALWAWLGACPSRHQRVTRVLDRSVPRLDLINRPITHSTIIYCGLLWILTHRPGIQP